MLEERILVAGEYCMWLWLLNSSNYSERHNLVKVEKYVYKPIAIMGRARVW